MPVNNKLSDEAVTVRRYAIRRVNPFLGVLQVIETEGGRAVSANGVVWDIEVRTERSRGWGSLNQNKNMQTAYYRYGLWSKEDGLVSRPLAPHLENDPLAQQCNTLIECVLASLDRLPFKLIDNRELWLFDSSDQLPLALLASATADSKLPSPEPKYWSSCIGANGVASQQRHPAARELEALVQETAGFNINKYWLTRQRDGSGVMEVSNNRIPANMFPVFMLSENWPHAEQSKLVSDYLEWTAPCLLTLQHLDNKQRQRMEKSLNIQAISVEHHWHLYPEIIDEKQVNAARVQCRLQKANQRTG